MGHSRFLLIAFLLLMLAPGISNAGINQVGQAPRCGDDEDQISIAVETVHKLDPFVCSADSENIDYVSNPEGLPSEALWEQATAELLMFDHLFQGEVAERKRNCELKATSENLRAIWATKNNPLGVNTDGPGIWHLQENNEPTVKACYINPEMHGEYWCAICQKKDDYIGSASLFDIVFSISLLALLRRKILLQ